MDIRAEIQNLIARQLQQEFGLTKLVVDIYIERPADELHGDWASNVAMTLAKDLHQAPIQIADKLARSINAAQPDFVTKVEVAGPGFLNFYVNPNAVKQTVAEVLSLADNYGKSTIGAGKQVAVEFGQPNTHKAFHVGHLKSAISGLAVVRLFENLGYEVIKMNYFGDIGMQVAKSTWAFMQHEIPADFVKWGEHQKMKYIDQCYAEGSKSFEQDPQAEAAIRELNREIYSHQDTPATRVYKQLREYSLQHQESVWHSLGVFFDRQYPESEIADEAIKIVEQHKGDVFELSEGAVIYRGEKEGLTNWVFLTSEDNPTYSAKDLALAAKKFSEYPKLEKAYVTTSVEQKDYFKVVIRVLEIVNPITKGRYFHIPFGWLLRSGKKFSSRMGESIKGMDILNEAMEQSRQKISQLKDYPTDQKDAIVAAVANAGLKFLILSHEFHKDISYDPESFISFDGFSGPYILYTYARAKSILRKSEAALDNTVKNIDQVWSEPAEMAVIKLLAKYPEVAERAGVEIAPHLVANYLYELAQAYNQFYANLQVLSANEPDRMARLQLTQAVAQVLNSGLGLLGIGTVEQM